MTLSKGFTATGVQLFDRICPWLPPRDAIAIRYAANIGNWHTATLTCMESAVRQGLSITAWERHWLTQLTAHLGIPSRVRLLRACPVPSTPGFDMSALDVTRHLSVMLYRLFPVEVKRVIADALTAGDYWSAVEAMIAFLDDHQVPITRLQCDMLRRLWMAQKVHGHRLFQLHPTATLYRGAPELLMSDDEFEDLAAEAIRGFLPRVSPASYSRLSTAVEGCAAIDALVDVLAVEGIPVTPAELDTLARLLDHLDLPPDDADTRVRQWARIQRNPQPVAAA